MCNRYSVGYYTCDADLLSGKGGARTKSVDLRNWLGCNGRSVFFWTFLGTPDRRTALALAQSQPVVVIVSRSPPSWPNQLVLALLKCFPGATLGGTRPQKGVRALWLLKSIEPLSTLSAKFSCGCGAATVPLFSLLTSPPALGLPSPRATTRAA